MSRSHLWTWVGVVCLFCAGAMYAQQDQPAGNGSAANSSAVAAVPWLIKFSGRVLDARGEPLASVAVRLTFAVYEEPTGGAALWAESQVAQLDEQGHYAVLLGATRADGLLLLLGFFCLHFGDDPLSQLLAGLAGWVIDSAGGNA